MIILFWISLFIIFYAFAGYGIFLYALIKLKRIAGKRKAEITLDENRLPTVALLIAAYNEEAYIEEKNSELPGTGLPGRTVRYHFCNRRIERQHPSKIQNYPQVKLYHKDERGGKMAAIKG